MGRRPRDHRRRSNPMAGVDAPTKAGKRERVLSDDELGKVWQAAGGDAYGDIVKLLVLTGARREEITQLRWDEIDGAVINLPGDRTKTGEPRRVPLSKPALEILAGVPRNGAEVFGSKRAWSRAKARIDAATRINEPWVIHDLRRTAATGMQKLGITLQVVEAVLGHTGTRAGIVGIYQKHDFAAEKKAALEAWGSARRGPAMQRAAGDRAEEILRIHAELERNYPPGHAGRASRLELVHEYVMTHSRAPRRRAREVARRA